MREKGYSETSLSDVAAASGMSPSHLLYYFDGKRGILEHLFESMIDGLHEALLALESKPPDERIDSLARLFFGRDLQAPPTLAIYYEAYGVAVHDEGIRSTKRRFDRMMLDFLERLFEATPRRPGLAARTAAQTAFAVVTGLRMNTYFAEDLDLVSARALLQETLFYLAGLPRPDGGRRSQSVR